MCVETLHFLTHIKAKSFHRLFQLCIPYATCSWNRKLYTKYIQVCIQWNTILQDPIQKILNLQEYLWWFFLHNKAGYKKKLFLLHKSVVCSWTYTAPPKIWQPRIWTTHFCLSQIFQMPTRKIWHIYEYWIAVSEVQAHEKGS